METFIAPGGVCFQRYNYDCGPAAAVTALRELGIEAEEGPIAVAAYTTPIYGTTETLLTEAINKLHRPHVISYFRYFKTIDEIKGLCPVIAVVKYAFLVDHYVTVIEVQQDKIIVGDPLQGKVEMTPDEFKNKWRFSGIVVKRTGKQSQ
jgi:predicted double-glycine peptidase